MCGEEFSFERCPRCGERMYSTSHACLNREVVWGVAVPEADGWINPSQVKRADSRAGAEHKARIYGAGHVVVTTRVHDWEVVR